MEPSAVDVAFFPEENGWASMTGSMQKLPRAYALFDLAKLILNKPERHVVRLTHKPAADGTQAPLFLVIPSEAPFLTREEALRYLFRRHADLIFREVKTPIDAPKGNFAFVNRCGITGALLGPPNYHGYQPALVRHHQQRLAHMPFDRFKSKIETVHDPEAVKAWVELMSFKREYECLLDAPPNPNGQSPAPVAPPAAETPKAESQPAQPAETTDAAATSPEPKPATPATESTASAPATSGKRFKSRDELEKHVIENHLDKFIFSAPEVRISGQASRHIEHRGILEAVRRAWEAERKYPLNTANGVRGRLRKEGFHFFKYKGVTFISVVRTKRFESVEGLTGSVKSIVALLRSHEGIQGKAFLEKLLSPPAAPTTETVPSAEPSAGPSPDLQAQRERVLADLHWLLMEGYVVEFSDGRLWALPDKPPSPPPAAKKDSAAAEPTTVASEEHEPELAETASGAAPFAAKLGVIHYNWPGFSFADFLRFAAESGYGYVELQLPDVWGKEITDPESNAERVRREVESFGLKVSALAAHNDFVQLDEGLIQAQVERMKRVCGLARLLGTNVIRSEGGQPKEGVPQDRWLEAMHGCFARCLPFLEETQVSLAIDNHGVVTNDGDLLFALITKINHKRVGSNLDTMNFRWFGHDIATCNRFYEMLAPHVLHSHLKDGTGSRENYKGAALGEGEINLSHALHCLRKAGYDGVYCAEYEGPEAQGGVGYRKCAEWLKGHVVAA